MKKQWQLLGLSFVFLLSGCVVRTYQTTKDRVDQNLNAGNLGYLKGQAPESERAKERKVTRTTQIVEVELHSPIKFEKMPKKDLTGPKPERQREDAEVWGNRGYITQSVSPEIEESGPSIEMAFSKYKVKKGDTLQNISKEFYGTTKSWNKIYEANRGALKGPDKIYPGQELNIPGEGLKEPKENLK